MYIQIAPKVRVYVNDEQMAFINKYREYEYFRNTNLEIDEIEIAKLLANKSLLVRKKLDNDVQYALNKHIRFVDDAYKK